MFDLYATIFLSIANIAAPYLVVRFDRKRLSRIELERGWNGPSFACAVYFFGPLCLPAHYWRTRRTPLALALGALATLSLFGAEWLLLSALEWAIG